MDATVPTRKPRKLSTTILNDAAVRGAKPREKDWKLSDSGGLHLLIKTTGKKLWRFSYRFVGKQKTLSFGAYPAVSLLEARDKLRVAREKLKAGVDPSVDRKLRKMAAKVASENTFAAIGAELMRKAEKDGKAIRTVERNEWLLSLAEPFIGSRPISELSVIELMQPLKRLEEEGKLETAGRLRVIMGMVFRYAVQTGRATIDPTSTMRGALPQPKVKNRAAIVDEKRLGELVRKIWNYHGDPKTRIFLQLSALFFCRPGELRNATWSEFDLVAKKWVIPVEHDKMRRGQEKPLSNMAISILSELQELTGRFDLVFPQSKDTAKPISEGTPDSALNRMGIKNDAHSVHGFRATASTILNESGRFRADVIERELGHGKGAPGRKAVRDIYNRAEYWPERVIMCAWWAEKIAFMVEPRIRVEPWPENVDDNGEILSG